MFFLKNILSLQQLSTASESGWDLSSRWFHGKKKSKNLDVIENLPVDLNALMCWNLKILEYLLLEIGEFYKRMNKGDCDK